MHWEHSITSVIDEARELKHTFRDACHCFVLVAIGLLQSVEDIDFIPVREHLANHRSLVAILLSEFSKVAFVVKSAGRRVVGLGVTIGPATTSASEATSSAACRAPAASRGGPGCYLRHGVVFDLKVGLGCGKKEGNPSAVLFGRATGQMEGEARWYSTSRDERKSRQWNGRRVEEMEWDDGKQSEEDAAVCEDEEKQA